MKRGNDPVAGSTNASFFGSTEERKADGGGEGRGHTYAITPPRLRWTSHCGHGCHPTSPVTLSR